MMSSVQKSKKHLFKKAKINRSHAGNTFILIFILIMGAFTALPLVYAVSNSLKPLDELWIFPPPLFPNRPTLQNYADLFSLMGTSWVPMSRYLFNTVFITICGVLGQVIFASMCAFPLSKHNFFGKKIIFKLIFFSLMFSPAVTAVPTYLVMEKLGWIDSYLAIIVPAMGSSIGLYLMKQFMEQIPDALLESASIDGAGEWRKFWIIIMPLVKPAWLTLMVFSVQSLWNMGASVMIYNEQLKTLPYAISQIVSGGIARAGASSAVMVLMMIVPITVFLITQSNIIQTMASSGIKE